MSLRWDKLRHSKDFMTTDVRVTNLQSFSSVSLAGIMAEVLETGWHRSPVMC